MGKRGPKPGTGGRPLKTLDVKAFEGLCRIQCTEAEICSFLDMDNETLTRLLKEHYNQTFSQAYKRLSDGGKASLRRTQLKMAEKSAAMAIWLGKQYLGQRDLHEIKQETTINNVSDYKSAVEELKHILKEIGMDEISIINKG